MNTSLSAIRAALGDKLSTFVEATGACDTCDESEFAQYSLYAQIHTAIGYDRAASIYSDEQILGLGGFTDVLQDSVSPYDATNVIVPGAVVAALSAIATTAIADPAIESDLKAASQCIREQIADYLETDFCCDCDPDNTFDRFVFYSLVDTALRYSRVESVLTAEQIQGMIGHVGCAMATPLYVDPAAAIIPGSVIDADSGGCDCEGTPKAIAYYGADGKLTGNVAELHWDYDTLRMGVGTNAPDAKLHVVAAAADTYGIHIKSGTATTATSGLFIENSDSTRSLRWRSDGAILRDTIMWSLGSDPTLLNTTWGYNVAPTLTTGTHNLIMGPNAGFFTGWNGSETVIMGSGATAQLGSTGGVAIGRNAVTASGSTAVGYYALNQTASSTGTNNSAFGSAAGYRNTTGYLNCYFGTEADYDTLDAAASSPTGYYNIVIGGRAMVGGAFNQVFSLNGRGTASQQIVYGGATYTALGVACYYNRILYNYSATDTHEQFFRNTTPEGSQTAPPGSIAYVDNAGAGQIYVKESGTGNTGWVLLTSSTGSVTSITVTTPAGILVSGASSQTITTSGTFALTLTNDLAALEGLSSTGFSARIGSDTWAQRTIAGVSNEIDVANGDGVSGNPTISLPTSVTLTGKTLTGGTFSGPTINVLDTLFTIQDNADSTKQIRFQASGITSGVTRTWAFPNTNDTFVGTTSIQTVLNKNLDNTNSIAIFDSQFTIQDNADSTKQAAFQASGIATGTTRTFTFPDASGTFAVSASGNIALSAAGNITFTGTLATASGGTGVATFGGTNALLYTTSADTLSSIATANTSALVTNSSGVPGWTSGSTGNRVLRTDGTTIAFGQVVEADVLLADNTTNNASTSNHGFLKKLDNDAAHYMDGQGNWTQPKAGILTCAMGNGNTVGSSTTVYGQFGFGSSFNATIGNRSISCPYSGTIKYLYVRTLGAQSGTGSIVVTLMKGGVAQTLTVTIAAGSAAGTFTDLSNSFTVAQGDLISIQLTNNATATSCSFAEVTIGVYQ